MIPILPISVRDTTSAIQMGAERANQARQNFLGGIASIGTGFKDLGQGTAYAHIIGRIKREEDAEVARLEQERALAEWKRNAGQATGLDTSNPQIAKALAASALADQSLARDREFEVPALELETEGYIRTDPNDSASNEKADGYNFNNVNVGLGRLSVPNVLPQSITEGLTPAPSAPSTARTATPWPTTVARAAETAGINIGYQAPSDLDRMRREQAFNEEQARIKAEQGKLEDLQKFIDSEFPKRDKEYGDMARGIDKLNEAIASGDQAEIGKAKNEVINQKLKAMAGSAITPLEFARQMSALVPPEELDKYYTELGNLYNVDRNRIMNALQNPSLENAMAILGVTLAERLGAPGTKADAQMQALAQKFITGGEYARGRTTPGVDPQWLADSLERSLPEDYRALQQAYNATRGQQLGGFGQQRQQQGEQAQAINWEDL